MSIPYRWLLASVVFIVIEILPPAKHFACFAFAVGALGAAIAATFSSIVWLPWLAFVLVSIALMPILISLAKFLFASKKAE